MLAFFVARGIENPSLLWYDTIVGQWGGGKDGDNERR